MKNFYFVLSLSFFLSLFACSSDRNDPRPACILVRVSGECVCNVFIYSGDLCIQSKIFDCQETSVLSFSLYIEGDFSVKAEYKNKSTFQVVSASFGKTTEVGLIL